MKTHKLSKHPLYNLWNSVKGRCYFVNSTSYKFYGGKGIGMCDEWKNKFENFYGWCIENGWQEGLSIERKDNLLDYSPSNCKFIQLENQNKNRSSCRIFEINGRKQILADWCREFNISYEVVRHRLKKGWSFEKSIKTPLLKIYNQNNKQQS